MNAPDHPRRLLRQWTALLLAPLAWVAALGILFPLTEEACARNSRTAMWVILAVCVLSTLGGAWLAWRDRAQVAGNGGEDRARFLAHVALGMSAIFLIVLLVMAPPILFVGACRT
ncbi:MAG TPA: hypothetical protein VFZ95_03160 [Steroidobacteraceae bacterium]